MVREKNTKMHSKFIQAGITVLMVLVFVYSGFTAVIGSHVCHVDFVAQKLGDPNWVILDGRDAADYEKGHIPGAVSYGKPVVTVLKHPVDGRVVSVSEAGKLPALLYRVFYR